MPREVLSTARLDGRTALVTGAARGQGRAHALALARAGANVVVCDIGEAEIEGLPYALGTAAELTETEKLLTAAGAQAASVRADLRDPAQVERVTEVAIERFGAIDIAIINHGICTYRQIVDSTETMWREMVDTNLHSYFYCARAVAPGMQSRGWGRIVMTSSGLARGGAANVALYTAAKWGVIGLMKSLAAEVAASGVTVNCVLPLITYTPMILHDELYRVFRPDLSEPTLEDFKQAVIEYVHPQRVPWGMPEDISDTVMFIVSEEASLMTGGTLYPSGGDAIRTSS